MERSIVRTSTKGKEIFRKVNTEKKENYSIDESRNFVLEEGDE